MKSLRNFDVPQILAAVLIGGLTLCVLFDSGGARDTTKFNAAIAIACFSMVAVFFSPRRFESNPIFVWGIGLAWVLGFLQTIPLPASVINLLSPHSAIAYQHWIPSAFEKPDWIPLSVAPDLTRKSLASLAMFVAVVWLARFWSGKARAVFAFLLTILAGGVVLSFVGLSGQPSSSFGPFVNNNNAGAFLSLCIGSGLGALAYLRHSKSGNQVRIVLTALCWVAITVLVVGLLGTGSRGAFLGLLAGGLGATAFSLRAYYQGRFAWLALLTVGAAWILLLSLGLASRFLYRAESLWTADALRDPRVTHWQDGLRAATNYLPLGSGLGTYRYAHLPFQRDGGRYWFTHADGMPVEWLLEGGLWGLVLTAFVLGIVVHDAFTIGRRRTKADRESLAIGDALIVACIFGVPALIVTQCFDYGILQPSSFFVLACLLGGLAYHAQQRTHSRDEEAHASTQTDNRFREERGLAIRIASTALLVAMLLLAVFDLFAAATVERVARDRNVWLKHDIADAPSLQPQIETLHRLHALKRQDASLHLLMGNLIMDEQRRLGARYLADSGIAPEKLRAMVSPRTLRRALASSSGEEAFLEQLILPTQDLDAWRRARQHAAEALVRSPLNDGPRVLLVELDVLISDSEASTRQLVDQLRVLRVGNGSLLGFYKTLEEVNK